MAFKMKAGKEGPMRKNFPAAFKNENRTKLLAEGIKKRMKALQDEIEKNKKMGLDFSQQMKQLSKLEDELQNVKKPN
tara:strand:+ start:1342 stop:1572 length:231 start_codon:yes stop_codon:yes gene_type:complete